MTCTAGDCAEGCCFCDEPIRIMVAGSDESGYTVRAVQGCKVGHVLGSEYGDPSLELLQERLNEGHYTEGA